MQTSLPAQLNDIARLAPANPSASLLRHIADERGWRGLDDEDYEYAAGLLDCGHSLPVALERLYSGVSHVLPAASEPAHRWRCGNCGELHDDEDEALDCCPPQVAEVWLCGRCESEHWHEDEARECCTPGGKA